MASPFEVQTDATGQSVGRRREEFRIRSRARKTIAEQRVATHWKLHRDVVWQKNPDRVLKYRPSHLHYYGWFPLVAVWRNWKATVFSEVYLHVQSVFLLSWVALLHITGLRVPDNDLATLVVMFGNPFLGGIFNSSMLVVFILGLFITLVINRWWTIRAAYTKLMGTTMDLCMTVANSVQDPANVHDHRITRARVEITRLLNLGHLLVIGKADNLNADFKRATGLRTLYRGAREWIADHLQKHVLVSVQSGSPGFARMLTKPRELLSYETMVNAGLMNKDEWVLLDDAESDGMPAYQMVYYWAQALVNKCCAQDWVIAAAQMQPMMLNKINAIAESASAIITTINSQMPYPYVHLVSFVVHAYLFVLATWFGCFLHTGRLGEKFELEGEDLNGEAIKNRDLIKTSPWMIFWCYTLMMVANITYQGLLDMHTLLDNPFGNHCAKFPLRANVGNVCNASRTMLMYADRFPAAFEDIFQPPTESVDLQRGSANTQRPLSQEFVDFANPVPSGQFPLNSGDSLHGTTPTRSVQSSRRARDKQTVESSLGSAPATRRSGADNDMELRSAPQTMEQADIERGRVGVRLGESLTSEVSFGFPERSGDTSQQEA